MIIGIKYHVPSQGETGKSFIWRIYENIDQISQSPEFQGMQGPGIEYIEHIEIEDGVESWTGEELYRIGYALFCEGEVEYFTDPTSGLRHARIYKEE